MADLSQIFRPTKANTPKPFLSQKTAQKKWKSEIQYISPPKPKQFNFEKCITKDIKKNISRYNMEQEYFCYQSILKRETTTKLIALNVFFFIGLIAGIYSFYKWMHMVAISTLIVLSIQGHFSVFKIERSLQGNYRLRLNDDYTLAQNSSSYQFGKIGFIIAINLIALSLFSQIRNSLLQYFDQAMTASISSEILALFSAFHFLLLILVQIYWKAISGKHSILKVQNNNSLKLFKLLKYSVLCMRAVSIVLRQHVFILCYIAIYGLVFGKIFIDSFFFVQQISLKPFFTVPFIFANLLAFIIIISILHFCNWVSNLLIYKYDDKINNIHLYVSLLKLQNRSANRQIHRKCLQLILNKLKENQCFMDRQIRTSKYYKNYWDIFEDYMIEQIQVALNFYQNIYGNLKQAQIVRKTDKSFLQDLFILDRKVWSIMKTEWNLIRFLDILGRIRLLFSILDKGRNHIIGNEKRTQLSAEIKKGVKQIADKSKEFISGNFQVCSSIVSECLYEYQQAAEKIYEILDTRN